MLTWLGTQVVPALQHPAGPAQAHEHLTQLTADLIKADTSLPAHLGIPARPGPATTPGPATSPGVTPSTVRLNRPSTVSSLQSAVPTAPPASPAASPAPGPAPVAASTPSPAPSPVAPAGPAPSPLVTSGADAEVTAALLPVAPSPASGTSGISSTTGT